MTTSVRALLVGVNASDATEDVTPEDGPISVRDVARAAGVSVKVARKAMEASVRAKKQSRDGITMTFDSDEMIDPVGKSASEIAAEVAKALGLGRYGVLKRAAARPHPPKKERTVNAPRHTWRLQERGRSYRMTQGGRVEATLTCGCGKTETMGFRVMGTPDSMDNKFKFLGWRVDPAKCPACINTGKEKPLSARPSPAAVQVSAKMFKLISLHFDGDTGTYAEGWSDERVAKDSGAALQMVSAVREETFGPLKTPAEIEALAADIAGISALMVEKENEMRSLRDMLEGLKIKFNELRKKFAA